MTHWCPKCKKFQLHMVKFDGKGHVIAASCIKCREIAEKGGDYARS